MSPRTPILLLAMAASLLGLALYVSVTTVFAAGVDPDDPTASPPAAPGGGAEPGSRPPALVQTEPVRTWLTYEVVSRARLLPAPARPRCRLVRAGDASAVVAAPGVFVAGSAALPLPAAAVRGCLRGNQLVAFDVGGRRVYRVTRLSGDPDEVVDFAWTHPQRYVARVVDEAGRPVVGARVWLAGRDGSVTGADGVFEVEGLHGQDSLPLVIRAGGKADYFQEVGIGYGDATPVHVLRRGVALRVQFGAALPADGRAVAHVYPQRAGFVPYPFFWSALPEAVDRKLDGTGSCTIQGVPIDVSLRVVVHHPRVPAARPVDVRLHRDAEVVVAGEIAPVLAGRVVAEHGAPIGGALLVSRAGASDSVLGERHGCGMLLPPAAFLARVAHATAAADGKFALGLRQRRDRSLVSAHAPGHLGLELRAHGDALPEEVELHMPLERDLGEPEIRIDVERPVRVRERRGGAVTPWREMTGPLRLEEPSLVDLRVWVRRTPDGVADEHTFSALPVAGRVDLGALR